jgi:hypothetical protein
MKVRQAFINFISEIFKSFQQVIGRDGVATFYGLWISQYIQTSSVFLMLLYRCESVVRTLLLQQGLPRENEFDICVINIIRDIFYPRKPLV